MNHDIASSNHPIKYGTAVMISVGLRPIISAKEPAAAPPNKAPTGANA